MIDTQTRALLEGGGALIVGTVDDDGHPHAARGWGLDIVEGHSEGEGEEVRVRLLVPDDDPVALATLRPGCRVAVTATDVASLVSVQTKGRVLELEPATAADRRRVRRYCDAFFGEVERVDGTPLALLERLVPRDVRACTVVLDEWYDQTPGPRAGTPLGATTDG